MLKKVYAFFMVIVASTLLAGNTQTSQQVNLKNIPQIPSSIQPLLLSISPILETQTVTQIGNQVKCLAKNIYFEAATQSTAGKLAVAFVTKNRVDSNRFPNSFCEVIYQGPHWASGLPKRNRCQFSWYCDGKSDDPRKAKSWSKSQSVAQWFYDHQDRLMDITDGATHYHADWMEKYPHWATKYLKVVSIDDHIFYQNVRSKNIKIMKTSELTLARL